ncbi:Met-10+ like-protein-domain-containing protein [Phlebopus sp. FC_14]|nr:Met-10+ like-protein-domain-containing protein [Phlebopus sp. FC_14]
MQPALDASPPVHRWMKDSLDRSVFHKSLQVLGVRIPANKTSAFLASKALRNYIMGLPKIRNVVTSSLDRDHRVVVLQVTDEAALSPEARSFIQEHSAEFAKHTVNLDYDYWTADDILQSILPEELCEGSPSGFSITGHIAHMNLNREYLPYKYVIGQVILDASFKNPALKTVINKVDTIDTTFRFFRMELLAGEPNYVVEHHESDCCFTFDFSRVYWNSRLQAEHDRVVQLVKPDDVIADVFAGVGPFAVPAGKKGCGVLANDLNPDSARYLSENIAINKVDRLVRASCEDGRDFIRNAPSRVLREPFPAYAGPQLSKAQAKLMQRKMQRQSPSHIRSFSPERSHTPPLTPRRAITHFIMNLPESALLFLDAFRGILSSLAGAGGELSEVYTEMPMVHCYCFTREAELEKAEQDIKQRAEAQLGAKLDGDLSIHHVRSVAPSKDMYCISFRLPRSVAFAQ